MSHLIMGFSCEALTVTRQPIAIQFPFLSKFQQSSLFIGHPPSNQIDFRYNTMTPPQEVPFQKTLLSNIKNQDLTAKRNEYLFPLPQFLVDKILPIMENKEDIVMVHLMFNMFTILIPCNFYILAFVKAPIAWWGHGLVILYCISMAALFFPRYTLMLHYASHREIFKQEYWALNYIMPYLISPFCGFYLGIGYHLHHVMMHHTENNTGNDVSETESFQRDLWSSYFLYYVKFWYGMIIYPAIYALKVRAYLYFGIHVTSISAFFLMFRAAWMYNPLGAFWVFAYPCLLMSLLLSFGNYSQHIFVDPDRSTKNHSLSYNCMNHFLNQNLFNDGYHVQHHINGTVHWSKLPSYFMENLDSFAYNDGIVFQGLHFADVGFLVLTGQWKKLASHYVYVDGGKDYSEEELIAMFKHRCKPVKSLKK